jgi:hypothetical protein
VEKIFRMAADGLGLNAIPSRRTRTAEARGRLFFYYVCRRSPAAKKMASARKGA